MTYFWRSKTSQLSGMQSGCGCAYYGGCGLPFLSGSVSIGKLVDVKVFQVISCSVICFLEFPDEVGLLF